MAIDTQSLSGDQKCACMLVLDTSGSMGGAPIDQLNQGLKSFEKALKSSPLPARRLDIGIVTFGNGGVQLLQPFISGRQFEAPQLKADDQTPIGLAVRTTLKAIRGWKNECRSKGIPYYRPWLMLFTAGALIDDDLDEAVAELKHEEDQKGVKGVTFFPIGVGDEVDLATLSRFSSKPPSMLKDLDFDDVFANCFLWLS